MYIIKQILLLILCLTLLSSCSSVVYSTKDLPYILEPKVVVESFDYLQTPLGKIYAEAFLKDPNLSGAMLIGSGTDALLHRIALVRMAEHSIEMQTYIYENGLTSLLLLHEMKLAADRGVKIRILVDDFGLKPGNTDIMLMDYHPNIEVKIFNPFKYRTPILRYPQLVFKLGRLNYRMHNKMFIVDDAAAIIGGRNVADNYFDNGADINFFDTDVLFLGRIAVDAVKSFNDYWDFHMSIPASLFPEHNSPAELDQLDKKIVALIESDLRKNERYNDMMNGFINAYTRNEYPIYWGTGILVADRPEKAEGKIPVSPIYELLEYKWADSKDSIYLASAYFVPGKNANQQIIDSSDRGININILTNSLSSTDVKLVYAGWMRYRNELLEHGVRIYEFRNGGDTLKRQAGSNASLHSKIIIFDDEVTWVGSFNIDARSANLNTEVVGIFYSEDFAKVIHKNIKEEMSINNSWHLSLVDGKVIWHTNRNGEDITVGHSPDSSWGMRSLMYFLSLIVPESLL